MGSCHGTLSLYIILQVYKEHLACSRISDSGEQREELMGEQKRKPGRLCSLPQCEQWKQLRPEHLVITALHILRTYFKSEKMVPTVNPIRG